MSLSPPLLHASTAAEPATPARPRGAWTLAFLFAACAGGLPALLYALVPTVEHPPPPTVVLTLAILALSVTRLSFLLARGVPRILTAVLWMFVYISGAVVPLAQAHTGAYLTYTMDSRYLPQAQAVILVFALALEAGGLAAHRYAGVVRMPSQLGTVSDPRLAWLTALASLATLYWVARLGGPAAFFESRWALGGAVASAGLRSSDSQVGSAVLGTLGQAPVLVAWIAWTVKIRRRPELRVFSYYALWAWLFMLNVVVNNPVSNPRFWMLTVLVGFLFAMPGFGPRQFRRAVVIGILAAIVIFPYTDYFRTGQATGVATESIAVKISNKDYDQSTMTANGIWWVNDVGHTGGRQILGAALFWVPRQMWPGKPADTGVLIGRAMQGPTDNLSSPLWLELWVDFGLAGTAAGGALLGVLARKTDDAFIAARSRPTRGLSGADLLFPLLAGYAFILMRGPLLQSMSRLSMLLLTTAFLVVLQRPSPEAQPAPGPTTR